MRKKGLTLIELTITLALITIMAMVVGANQLEQAKIRLAQNTAVEVRQIQEAAMKYYVDNKTWPADIAALKAGGYLDPNWNAVNKFGNTYTVSSAVDSFTVNSGDVGKYTNVVRQVLPQVVVVGNSVKSTIPVPGGESSHDPLLHRLAVSTQEQRTVHEKIYVDDVWLEDVGRWASESTVPPGSVILWRGAACPAGFTRVSALDGKFLVGGSSYVVNAGGSNTHNHGGSTAGHTLTIAEMPAHSHTDHWSDFGSGDASGGGTAGYPSTTSTGTMGENQPHSHTITAADNRPEFSTVLLCEKD